MQRTFNVLVILFLLFAQHLSLFAQTYPIWENNGYGLIDNTGKVVFPTIATTSDETTKLVIIFSDDTKRKFGLISKDNKVLLPAVYDYIYREPAGFTLSKNDKRGFADSTGKLILETSYASIEIAGAMTLIAKEDSLAGLLSIAGKKITDPSFSEISFIPQENCFIVKKNEKYGTMDATGTIIVPIEYTELNVCSVKGRFLAKKNGKAGLIDTRNTVIIPFIYKSVDQEYNSQTDHIFFLCSSANKIGIYNQFGKAIAAPTYTEVKFIGNDFMLASSGKLSCLLDSFGKMIIPFCEEIDQSSEQRFFIVKKNGLKGIYTDKGKLIIPHLYKEIQDMTWDTVFRASSGKKEIYFNSKGKQLRLPHIDIDSLLNNNEGYADLGLPFYGLKKTGKWNVIDIYTGKTILPETYDSVFARIYVNYVLPGQKEAVYGDYDYLERTLRTKSLYNSINNAIYVYRGLKIGVMNTRGNTMVEPRYDDIGIFFRNRAIAKKENKYGCISSDGKEIIPFEFDTLYDQVAFSGNEFVISNFIKASKDKKFGIVDSFGKTVIDLKFDSMSDFTPEGYAFVTVGGKYGIIDKKGNYLIEPQSLLFSRYVNGLGVIELEGNPILYIGKAGNIIWRNKDKKYTDWVQFRGFNFPKNIDQLQSLEEYTLQITDPDVYGLRGNVEIPSSLYEITSLKRLSLNYKTGCLSDDIGKLKNLRTLEVPEYNRCAEIPKEIGDLPLLDSLIFDDYPESQESYDEFGNSSTTYFPAPVLPDEIEKLHTLKYLKTGLYFNKLPKEIKYLDIVSDTNMTHLNECLAGCNELENISVLFGDGPWDMKGLINLSGKLKKLNKMSLQNQRSGDKYFYMDMNPAGIDTLVIRGLYSDHDTLSPDFFKRPITYLLTNYDTLFFPELEHLKYIETSLYWPPKGLANCQKIKTLEMDAKSNAHWSEIFTELIKLSSLESLTLTIEPEYYQQTGFAFDPSFYENMNNLIAEGKLKTLRVNSDMLTEDCSKMLKNLHGLTVLVN